MKISNEAPTRVGANHEGLVCIPRRALGVWMWHAECEHIGVHTVHGIAHGPGEYPGAMEIARGCASSEPSAMVHEAEGVQDLVT